MRRRTLLKSLLAAVPVAFLSRSASSAAKIVIDGMGEIRLDYSMELIDEVLASGTRAICITLGNPGLHGPEAFDDALAELAAYDRHIADHPDRLLKIATISDLDQAVESSRLGLMYYLQNATPIQDRLDRVELLHSLGVRSIQLTYNTRNLVGDGCLERTNAGLSELGLELVARMNRLRMIVDVSHCGSATTIDAFEHSTSPVTINHAGCSAVYDHPRNKSDAILRAMAEQGGVVGIVQLNPFLSGKERSTLDDYLDHVDYAVNLCGIEHVGIGSDREHKTIPDTDEERERLERELARLRPGEPVEIHWPYFLTELNHPRRMDTIREGLEGRGYRPADVDRILGGNFLRLYRQVLG